MSTRTAKHQDLPPTGPEREALREKGQFWTPPWVAEAMAAYVLSGGARVVFDPAVGEGAFFEATKRVAREFGIDVSLRGRELHPAVLARAREKGLSQTDLAGVELRDFLLDPPHEEWEAIIANPPYIRHHRIPQDTKKLLKAFATRILGRPLDGRTGYHVFFLLRALTLLAPNGRLAFILPADTFEGVFARDLWKWIARRYRIDAVVTFQPEATPFPGVDTNAVVVLIRNSSPGSALSWGRCGDRSGSFKAWCLNVPDVSGASSFQVLTRSIEEALSTGLSRPPALNGQGGPTLADVAAVMRGIATGGNEFFFLTASRVRELELPAEFLTRAVGRTRDAVGAEFGPADFEEMAQRGRPCFLLSLDGRPLEHLPPAVQQYLKTGVDMGLPGRALIAQRRPWYKMEKRRPPEFLFAYLGRRNARFIRNTAGVVPLTGFLCVYARDTSPDGLDRLWQVLQHPDTIENLKLVGKSYGGGAIKVEPRALERLPLPPHVVAEAGLNIVPSDPQLAII